MFVAKARRIVSSLSSTLRLSHILFGDNFSIQNLQSVKTFDKTVDPFTKIFIETPMHLRIVPINLDDCANGDRLILNLFAPNIENSSKFNIKQSAKRVDVIGKGEPNADAICVIQAPIRASFDIKATGKSNITIEKMHSDECVLKTTSGSINVKDVRGKNIQLRTDSGCVTCAGTLQAENIDIRTDSTADVVCEHLRANSLKICTHGGNISTESCYSDESKFTTVVGSMKLANLHRNCSVEILEQGDLLATGFDGTIKAILKRGNVRLQASKLYKKNSIFVHESGLVDVRISSLEVLNEINLIDLFAEKLNVEEEVLKRGTIVNDSQHQIFRYDEEFGERNNELTVDCRNGSIDFKLSSWKDMMEESFGKHS